MRPLEIGRPPTEDRAGAARLATLRAPGSYLLLLRTERPVVVVVGALGRLRLPAGWHVYAGSARGGLAARLRHHLHPLRRPHWHIDYLRPHAALIEVWVRVGSERRECALADAVAALPGARRSPGFGSSDCRCAGHLVSLAGRPRLGALDPALVRVR